MATNFTVNEEYVEAEVYHETVSGSVPVYLVKAKLLEIGVYISGIRVQESPKRPEDGWWVQMPAVKIGWQWKKTIECEGGSPFLEIVERKARQAVDSYLEGIKQYPRIAPDIKLANNHEEDKPISLDDIPF